MDNITCELNGIKYLLIELFVSAPERKKYEKLMKEFSGIYQGVKEINKGGLFTDGYLILKVLIPENKVVEFNKHWE